MKAVGLQPSLVFFVHSPSPKRMYALYHTAYSGNTALPTNFHHYNRLSSILFPWLTFRWMRGQPWNVAKAMEFSSELWKPFLILMASLCLLLCNQTCKHWIAFLLFFSQSSQSQQHGLVYVNRGVRYWARNRAEKGRWTLVLHRSTSLLVFPPTCSFKVLTESTWSMYLKNRWEMDVWKWSSVDLEHQGGRPLVKRRRAIILGCLMEWEVWLKTQLGVLLVG